MSPTKSPADNNRVWQWGRVAISIVLLGLLIAWADIDLDECVRTLATVKLVPVLLALLMRPIAVWANTVRLAMVLNHKRENVRFAALLRACIFGELLSRFIPGNLGTVALVASIAANRVEATILQLLEKVLFLTVVLFIAAVALGFAGYYAGAACSFAAFVGVALGLELAKTKHVREAKWLPKVLRLPLEAACELPSLFGAYLALSLVSMAAMTVLFWLLGFACGGQLGLAESVAVVALTTIATAVPITINGAGIREWVFFTFVSDNLPSPEAVVTLALLTYLVGLIFAAFGAGIWAIISWGRRDAPS